MIAHSAFQNKVPPFLPPLYVTQVGMWIGVALGLLVVLGLLVLGVYFYMKQRALQSAKPPPYSRDRNSNGYAGGGLYAGSALSNGNDR